MTHETPRPSAAPKSPSELRIVIIGAGMSGVLSAIQLQESGYDNFSVYEKGTRIGGTWNENTYPGLSCDVPSHLYSYSFELNPDWSHRYSPGEEIQAYFENVARRHGIPSKLRLGQEVVRCVFENGRWEIALADGSRDSADVVIAATGVLHHPSVPDFEGLDRFAGPQFHSARWDHSVSLEGKRVGVVGTGSTAIQITTAVVDRVAEYKLFQRTPQWVMPQENPLYSEAEKKLFRDRPETLRALNADIRLLFTEGFSNAVVDADSPQLAAIHEACEANLEESVRDPELKEKLRPNYRAACKRLIISGEFYAAIQRPNANLVTDPIERIEESGVRTADGTLHELDVLVLATGFRVDRFVRPMEVVGRNGVALNDVWEKGPFAYLAITVPEFPNLFMLNGPNGPVGNFSLIDIAECQFAYILQLIERVRSGACREIAASREATRRFDAERREAAKKTIWTSGCQSWYLDADGVPMAWPWTFDRFKDEMREPRLDDFDLR